MVVMATPPGLVAKFIWDDVAIMAVRVMLAILRVAVVFVMVVLGAMCGIWCLLGV